MRDMNYRILAEQKLMSNDTWKTGLNNNDLIIGPSGSGKTRNYVKPNIMQCNESMIITDTKGSLHSEMSEMLKKEGYKVVKIDFTDFEHSDGYNPLDYVRYNPNKNKYNEQDILKIASNIVTIETQRDPFWEHAARGYLTCLIAYVLENLPKKQHTMEYVVKLHKIMGLREFDSLMKEMMMEHPDSLAANHYRILESNKNADKTHACIMAFLSSKLEKMSFDGAMHMFQNKERLRFRTLGKEKTAVFLEVSDTDRSMDSMINLFYIQALQELCESADTQYESHSLDVPVRIILDDFAANAYIPDFDKIISVIRSRNIYVSIILQSISQLEQMYSKSGATTIINNCDNCLYLGGQDVGTAEYISVKANIPSNKILEMPLGDALLFTRGQEYQKVQKYDITAHEKYVM